MQRRTGVAALVVGLVAILVVTQLPGSPVRLPVLGGSLGALEGTILLAGDAAVLPTVVANTTDPDVCGQTQSLEDLLVDRRSGGVANAVVALVDVPDSVRGPSSSSAPQTFLIDNRGCRFVPHVLVATLGDTLLAQNNDPVFHTTHYYGPLNENVALTEPGRGVPSVVDQTGIVTILCDLHGWMRGFVRVDAHRFHDVSDERGRFRIRGIPPGTYAVEIWHERLGTRRASIQVTAGRTTRLDVEVPLTDVTAR